MSEKDIVIIKTKALIYDINNKKNSFLSAHCFALENTLFKPINF